MCIEKPRKNIYYLLFLCARILKYFYNEYFFEIKNDFKKEVKAEVPNMSLLPCFPPQQQVHEFILH